MKQQREKKFKRMTDKEPGKTPMLICMPTAKGKSWHFMDEAELKRLLSINAKHDA